MTLTVNKAEALHRANAVRDQVLVGRRNVEIRLN